MKPDCSKIFQLLLVLTIVIVMVILSTHLTLKANFHYSVEDKPSCQVGYSNTYSKQIISNFTRNTDLFLNLNKIWWRQNEPAFDDLPYGLKGSEQSIIRILARIQYDMPESINRLACKKCVIIGNGYTLRNSSLGETINEYDIVIRINDAPVRGYEKDVGSKTTLRFFYPESATKEPNIENNPGTLLVFLPFKQVDVQWLREILYNEKRFRKGFWKPPPLIWEANPSNIRILNPYYIHQAATKLLKIPLKVPPKSKKKPVHPTTGFLAITVALNYCDEVHVAGFGYPLSQQATPIHYYGKTTMKEMSNSEHNVTHEQLFLKKLVDVGAIKYLTVLM
ncbi:CMP-N-acetylneuraminate-beta-galactosamide-alpha-2,3-sialyltransferase 4-like isoform X1 [Scyliorhinus canicula]|uniref:CMP-N-acetylneuraminate-beta-galactosamide- alpha-2,3-sialyltransferase 4-like isoform X1 n=2 Tax=Scyliorhinus canicula TaxID=7830 RepID=UPI0018F6298A|nr:CMP-N-acetylneuraminate-beta-galactosamide-alpha-2,3-sialyltransferase 4-like isoform X1 [Scyliorhinus canicula]XP_038634497.1 CMP-N-acetylneuraminate-beta-galactosamide-alpha-2,3-sialyltransferase 4-like isoform X1 [Scyliorhinus canicula]XP_038634498.1 CMP-N-acetylneuraminate-beta-galactosamide-alpha-2,3-sialyltransferase 4-like isoform X1 [Scyliorhinus canicula]XP_038634500.1 CMP-N-acetylneuraminate-beta-galactosamide-alpha-2,3-sialyltransferase 4-like isoform X1 [Scyliorhinus canicula]